VTASTVHQQEKLRRLREEVKEKRRNVTVLESRIQQQMESDAEKTPAELFETVTRLKAALGEKEFAVEIMTADNRILREQLKAKAQKLRRVEEELTRMKAAAAAQVATRNSPAGTPSTPIQGVVASPLESDGSSVSRALDFDGAVNKDLQPGPVAGTPDNDWRMQVLSKVSSSSSFRICHYRGNIQSILGSSRRL
jgi:hypothetical protein